MRRRKTDLVLILAIGVALLQVGCVPKAPKELKAQLQGETGIKLTWTDRASNEDGFYIYRAKTGTNNFVKIATNIPNDTDYVDNAGMDKDYEYKVTAFNDDGESSSTNTARARTKPNAPSDLVITNPITGEVSLSWRDNSEIEDCYVVERREVGGGNWSVVAGCLPPDTISFADTSWLQCQKIFEYRVAAYFNQKKKDRDYVYSDYIYGTGITCRDWTFQTVEDAGDKNIRHTSIAVDSSNKPHISYYYYYCPTGDLNHCGSLDFRDLKYATRQASSWSIETVDDFAYLGYYNSIAVGSGGVHITCFHALFGLVYYRKTLVNAWNGLILDIDDWVGVESHSVPGLYTNIALGGGGTIHVIHSKAAGFAGSRNKEYIRYIKAQINPFTKEVEDVDGGTKPSMVLGPGNEIHVSYIGIEYPEPPDPPQYKGLRYAVKSGSSWRIDTIDESARGGSSIAIDSKSKIHIVYTAYSQGSNLKYATNKSGAWQISVLDDSSGVCFPSIITEPSPDRRGDDIVHIVYCADGLVYATNESGEWRKVIMDPGPISIETSADIAIDINRKLHISYATPHALKYATNAEVK